MAKKSQPIVKALVIVESPAKAKTINRYLGNDYKVMASMGHIRDLPPNNLGIDLENNFEPVYEILASKKKVVNELKKAAKNASTIYLATDLDREGEAIAWHLVYALEIEWSRARRVVFNEITRSAIQEAFSNPHDVDMAKVNAQQARRLLDRIVGYQLSPLLQAKIGKGLSAGRVQSVSVRLIVAREQEIRAFTPEESWRVNICLATDSANSNKLADSWSKFISGGKDAANGPTIKERNNWIAKNKCLYAELAKVNGKEFVPKDVSDVTELIESLGYVTENVNEKDFEGYAEKGLKRITLKGHTDPSQAPTYTISDIQRKKTSTRPNAPYTTAALQQSASSMLGFAPSRTMRIAQQLYEGVDLGHSEGPVGLITYMRTDSTNLSKDSVEKVRTQILQDFGKDYLPEKPNRYAAGKRAQEAHEAIRPSDSALHPDQIRASLTNEQFKLYHLIWRRFVACQMTPAVWNNTTVFIKAKSTRGDALFKTSGRQLVFDGHLRVTGTSDSGDAVLPDVEVQAELHLLDLDPRQQFTSPPARYTEAALVKKMESEGIGRPSTYAAIIQTIQDRGYVDLLDKKLSPTARGELVTEKLIAHFPKVMDLKFTSFMEEELDKIEEENADWVDVLTAFYNPFKIALDKAQTEMQPARAEPSEYTCPECGKEMVYRIGKNGRFLSCSDYPTCKVARNIDKDGKPIDEVVAKDPCKVCGKAMILRKSRMGPFLGCSGYPDCSNTLPSDEEGNPLKKVLAEDIHLKCEDCQSKMAVKFARGKSFMGCTAYPKCKATQPIPPGIYVEKPKPQDAGVGCDKCGRPMVIRKGSRGPFLSCSGFPRCRNAMPVDKLDHLKQLAKDGKIPEAPKDNGKNGTAKRGTTRKGKATKVDIASLGPPPAGFAWTRTGRPVVEVWPEEPLDCPDCGSEVAIKTGRFGPYFGCTGYPKCSFVSNMRGEAKKRSEKESPTPPRPKPIPTDIPCDECGNDMVIRSGRSGQFLGCGKYPKCRFSKPLPDGMTVESATSKK